LALTDESDLMSTGVDIRVQPPGMNLRALTLLSGGQKALTAVSLIFSLFMCRPSPFCVLDEVDAPLDDANIDRFNQIVTEMGRESQFLIITHNQRTMEVADCLYGVTMEEPGVSRIVSVRLQSAA
jgi:chromosome segregation protein